MPWRLTRVSSSVCPTANGPIRDIARGGILMFRPATILMSMVVLLMAAPPLRSPPFRHSSTSTAVSTTIPGLTPEDNTPLLAGMRSAAGLSGSQANKVIVLLGYGYHNCRPMRTIGDPEVGSLIEQLREESIRVFTIGFGLPTDIDHPLLQGLADATTPPGYTSSQFYDVTTPGFVVADWHPATELPLGPGGSHRPTGTDFSRRQSRPKSQDQRE